MPSDVGGRDQDQPVQRGDVLVRPSAAIERNASGRKKLRSFPKRTAAGRVSVLGKGRIRRRPAAIEAKPRKTERRTQGDRPSRPRRRIACNQLLAQRKSGRYLKCIVSKAQNRHCDAYTTVWPAAAKAFRSSALFLLSSALFLLMQHRSNCNRI
jgi:hypothetical protein